MIPVITFSLKRRRNVDKFRPTYGLLQIKNLKQKNISEYLHGMNYCYKIKTKFLINKKSLKN